MKSDFKLFKRYSNYCDDESKLDQAIKDADTAERFAAVLVFFAVCFLIYKWSVYEDSAYRHIPFLTAFQMILINLVALIFIWVKVRFHMLVMLKTTLAKNRKS